MNGAGAQPVANGAYKLKLMCHYAQKRLSFATCGHKSRIAYATSPTVQYGSPLMCFRVF